MTNEEFIESIRLEGEEWRPVVGWEERYAVSSFGRIVSLETVVKRSDGILKHTVRKILKGEKSHRGHGMLYIALAFYNGRDKRIRLLLHRVVAAAFIPNPNNYPCVDHIDGNSLNNRADNLRWCTYQMNSDNPITRERSVRAAYRRRGIRNDSQSFKVVQLDTDNNLLKIYPSLNATEIDNFRHTSVRQVCKGIQRLHKGYKWMYLSDYELLINKSKNPNEGEI